MLVLAAALAACSTQEKHATLPNDNGNHGGSVTDDDASDDDTSADDDTVTDDDTTGPTIELALIYNHDTTAPDVYTTALQNDKIHVNAVLEADVPTADFTAIKVILIDDSTDWFDTGAGSGTARIAALGLPLLGVYDGGGNLFDNLGLPVGWDTGLQSDDSATSVRVTTPGHAVFNTPYNLGVSDGSVLTLFDATTFLRYQDLIPLPDNIVALAERDVSTDYSAITLENNNDIYWGFEMGPDFLTEVGREVLVNSIYYLSKQK
jgi:hypothetical protein